MMNWTSLGTVHRSDCFVKVKGAYGNVTEDLVFCCFAALCLRGSGSGTTSASRGGGAKGVKIHPPAMGWQPVPPQPLLLVCALSGPPTVLQRPDFVSQPLPQPPATALAPPSASCPFKRNPPPPPAQRLHLVKRRFF